LVGKVVGTVDGEKDGFDDGNDEVKVGLMEDENEGTFD